MKNASLQWKLTLWFSAALVLMAALTFVSVFFVSQAVLQKTVRDELIHTVEDNVDEVEFYLSADQMEQDGGADQYIRYGVGYLEIDDDFLDRVNGVTTALYQAGGALLYGENPLAAAGALPFVDGVCRSVRLNGETWYVFDRRLEQPSLRGLWLRGAVSESQADAPLKSIVRLCLWALAALMLFAIAGGVLIARRALQPVREMALAAARISGGDDLKKRIPVRGGDELAQLGAAFNGMIRRLDEAFEAERQFTADASHELRTPMAVLMAQCEEALSGEKTAAEYRDALFVIQRQGRRMSRLISGILELARMERGDDRMAREALDLSELVQSVSQDMALIREKSIELTAQVEPGLWVEGDPMLLTRLLANLIGNAYRYGRENGWIRVWLRAQDGDALLTVSDNGIGVAPEQQEKIFRRLYQAAADRSGDGLGLGLAMARQIARLHGGEITVLSEEGKGSAFTARLPRTEAPSAPHNA